MIHLIVSVALGVAQPTALVRPQGLLPLPSESATQAPAKPAGASPAKADDSIADAYYQFMMGRRLALEGDAEGAIKALRLAMAMDPASSQIASELAEVYARQGQAKEAIELADAALKLDGDNWDAHRLLGMIYADLAEHGQGSASGTLDVSTWQHAVDHLELALGDSRSDMAVGVRLTLGRMYLQRQNYEKAIGTLKQLLAGEPWLPQGVALLAETYTAAGKPGEAILLLKDAVEEEPSFYGALADAYDKQQRFAEAASAYERASEQNPRDAELKIKWAAALLNEPNAPGTARARDLLLDVTKTDPNASWPLYLLAQAQRLLDDLDGAEGTARRILALNPTSTSGAHALAQVFQARRQYARIVETLEPIVAAPQKGREADAALLLTQLGVAYLSLGRGDDAVGVFDRAIQTNPRDGVLLAYRAQGLVLTKKYDLALTLLRQLRAGRPDDLRLARLEAEALRGQGNFDAGVAVLRLLADAPGAGPASVQVLSEFYASDGRDTEAAAMLRTAQVKFPSDLNIQFQYGAVLDRLKRFDEAERVFRQVLATDPNHAAALNSLGYALVERGRRVPEALELIKRAVTLDPYNGSYLDSLGWAHFKLHQLDLAEASLRTASEQLVTDSVVQNHFGDVLAAKGRPAEAIEAWRRSLSGDGELIDRAGIERKIRDAQARVGKK
ncbi:MAG: tetratricopeptide repeat protein [Acidobacteria bacterium]|nr:tetratricopeptide repeat protein [Acidobacteriota bacterium]